MRTPEQPYRLMQFWSLVLLGAWCIGGAGCGAESSMVGVSGKVVHQGQSLPGGSVTFFPTAGRPVNAPLSTEGAYSVELEPGEYVVTVNYTEPLPAGFKEGDPLPSPKFVLAPEHSIRARSTLKATVAADQSEPIDFQLK